MPDENPSDEKRAIPRLNDDDMKEIAAGLLGGRYFTLYDIEGANDDPENFNAERFWRDAAMVFMPLALGGLEGLDIDELGNIIEDLNKAGPRSANGYPVFFSCRLIHKDDWDNILTRARKALAALS